MNTRAVVLSGAAIVGGVIVCAASVFLLLHWWEMPAGPARAPADHALDGPGAGLRSAPQQDLAAYRAEKERQLHAFGWVDPQHGIARIPIEAAMDLLVSGAAR
jgi:hypothetical protein